MLHSIIHNIFNLLYNVSMYCTNLVNLKEMDKFLDTHDLQILNQNEINNLNKCLEPWWNRSSNKKKFQLAQTGLTL